MASRQRKNYKFVYTDDFGRDIIKRQRVYVDENDRLLTPITSLFLNRVVETKEKVTGTSQGLRSLLTYIGNGRFEVKLPYNFQQQSELKAHIKEVLAVDRVICGDYRGEKLVTGGSSTNIQ